MKTHNDYMIFMANKLGKEFAQNLFKHGNQGITIKKFEFLSELVQKENFNSILEIGRYYGYSFSMFKFFSPHSHIVSIDIVERPEAIKVASVFDNYTFLTGTSDLIKINSDKYKFDLVLIDGEHTNEATLKDWNNIQNCLIKNKSVVFFDDLARCKKVYDTFEAKNKITKDELDYGVIYV